MKKWDWPDKTENKVPDTVAPDTERGTADESCTAWCEVYWQLRGLAPATAALAAELAEREAMMEAMEAMDGHCI